MFEKATRKKWRFASPAGSLSVEDLWDLPLKGSVSLNAVAITANKEIKDVEENFISPLKPKTNDAEAKLTIIKHVIAYRLDRLERAAKAQANKERRQKIMEMIDEKGDDALRKKSTAALKKLLKAEADELDEE